MDDKTMMGTAGLRPRNDLSVMRIVMCSSADGNAFQVVYDHRILVLRRVLGIHKKNRNVWVVT